MTPLQKKMIDFADSKNFDRLFWLTWWSCVLTAIVCLGFAFGILK